MTAIDKDLHIHTYLSPCCKDREHQTPAAIIALAEQMEVKTIGFADHIWMNPDLAPSDWYRPQDGSKIARLRADLAKVSTHVRVLVGCEAETIAPGKIGMTREFARQLDFVLLACSHFHMRKFVAQPAGKAPRDVARHLIEFFLSAVTSGIPTAIPHPFWPLGFMAQYDAIIASIPDAEFLDAFAAAAEAGVAIEATVHFLPPTPEVSFSLETPVRVLSLAKQAGCRFTFGTDSHDPAAQRRLPELVRLTAAVGITEDDLAPILTIPGNCAKAGHRK